MAKELSKTTYLEHKATKLSDKQIAEMYQLKQSKIRILKETWGLVGQKEMDEDDAFPPTVHPINAAVEWFMDINLITSPTIGVTKQGITFNQRAVEVFGIKKGDLVEVGHIPSENKLVFKKGKTGIPLAVEREVNLIARNRNLVGWLDQKGIVYKKYPFIRSKHNDIWVADLTFRCRKGG